MRNAGIRRAEAAEAGLLRLRERMEAINPMRVLERGYTLVTDRNGQVLTGSRQAEEAENIKIRFADGAVYAKVGKDGDAEHE